MTGTLDFSAARILIVDDDPIVRQALRTVAEQAEIFIVGEAANGKEAVAIFDSERPNVVCLDFEMPEMNGIEVLAHIRQRAPQTCVLLISAHNTTQTVLGAVRHNADGIINKPVTQQKLLREIERAFARKHIHNAPVRHSAG